MRVTFILAKAVTVDGGSLSWDGILSRANGRLEKRGFESARSE